MVKAGDQVTWGLLSAAMLAVTDAYQSPKLAESQLLQWLLASQLRWRSSLLKGRKRDSDPGEGSAEFWNGGPSVRLRVRWQESWARRTTRAPGRLVVRPVVHPGGRAARAVPFSDYAFYRIEVAQQDLARLLPNTRIEAPARTPPAEKLMKPIVWLNKARNKEHPQQRGEDIAAYAHRLHGLIQTAPVTRQWKETTLRRRLYDAK